MVVFSDTFFDFFAPQERHTEKVLYDPWILFISSKSENGDISDN